MIFLLLLSGFTTGAAFALFLCEFWILPANRKTDYLLYSALERDREEARHEAQVFRRIVLPAFDKAESAISGVGGSSSPAPENEVAPTARPNPPNGATPVNSPNTSALFNRRIPFRIRWKQIAKANNSKQKAHDELVAALSKQAVVKEIPKEKPNA